MQDISGPRFQNFANIMQENCGSHFWGIVWLQFGGTSFFCVQKASIFVQKIVCYAEKASIWHRQKQLEVQKDVVERLLDIINEELTLAPIMVRQWARVSHQPLFNLYVFLILL